MQSVDGKAHRKADGKGKTGPTLMSFKFIHTGDWHIGKPYGRFDERDVGVLRQARLDAVDRVAAAARDQGCKHVLVAGDVYDSQGLADRQLIQLIERLRQAEDLAWHLLPGNHDPVGTGSVWDRIQALGVPGHVHLHLENKKTELAPGVELLPAPCLSHRAVSDPTAWMDDASSAPETIRIGLAHGSAHGFGDAQEVAGLISPDRVTSAGLAYLALGDWHGTKEITPRCWYAGTPEPDQFPNNEPGYALCVSVEAANAPPQVVAIPTATYTWQRLRVRLQSVADVVRMEDDIRASKTDLSKRLVRLELHGALDMAGQSALAAANTRLSAALFHLRVRDQELQVATDDSDGVMAELGLTHVVDKLKARADTASAAPETDDAAVTRRALRQLAQYAGTVHNQRVGE